MHARVRNVATYAQFGGDPCPGEAAEMGPCNEQPCPSKSKWMCIEGSPFYIVA